MRMPWLSSVCRNGYVQNSDVSIFKKYFVTCGRHRYAVSGIRFDDFAQRLWGTRCRFCRHREGKKNQAYEAYVHRCCLLR